MPISDVSPFADLSNNVGCGECRHPLVQHWTMRIGLQTVYGCPHCAQGRTKDFPYCTKPFPVVEMREPKMEVRLMSAVNLCERCGNLMLGKAVATLTLQKTPTAEVERLEWCPGCVNDFVRFLETQPDRPNETYREPWKETKRPESMLMLEKGTCGDKYQDKYLCLRAKDHDGLHRDGEIEW